MEKVISKPSNSVPVAEMKDGEAGVIMNWHNEGYVGKMVQKCKGSNGGYLTVLKDIDVWEFLYNIQDKEWAKDGSCMIEITLPGTPTNEKYKLFKDEYPCTQIEL